MAICIGGARPEPAMDEVDNMAYPEVLEELSEAGAVSQAWPMTL